MRNVGIEIYRVSLMFGICVLHSITQGPYNSPLGARLLLWCVTGFVFISGWFGICPVTAVCIFLGCFLLDVPRRLFLNVIRTRRAQS